MGCLRFVGFVVGIRQEVRGIAEMVYIYFRLTVWNGCRPFQHFLLSSCLPLPFKQLFSNRHHARVKSKQWVLHFWVNLPLGFHSLAAPTCKSGKHTAWTPLSGGGCPFPLNVFCKFSSPLPFCCPLEAAPSRKEGGEDPGTSQTWTSSLSAGSSCMFVWSHEWWTVKNLNFPGLCLSLLITLLLHGPHLDV